MQTFSFNPPINLSEEERMLAVTSFETTISVFNRVVENKSFTPSHWSSRGGAESIHNIQILLELKFQNDIELHAKEVRKRGNQTKIGDKEYNLSDCDTRKKVIIKEFKITEYNDLEDKVFRMRLTYTEFKKIIDLNYFPTSLIGYAFSPGIYEFGNIDLMIRSLLPNELKVNVTIDDKIKFNH